MNEFGIGSPCLGSRETLAGLVGRGRPEIAVCVEAKTIDARFVSEDDGRTSYLAAAGAASIWDAPSSDLPITAGAEEDQGTLIHIVVRLHRIQSQTQDPSDMSLEQVNFSGRLEIPDDDVCIRAARDQQLSSSMPRRLHVQYGFDEIRVSAERPSYRSGRAIPRPDAFIPTSGDDMLAAAV